MNDLLETYDWNFFTPIGASRLPINEKRLLDKLPDIEVEIRDIVLAAQKAKSSNGIPLLRPKSYLHRLVYMLGRHVEGDADLENTLRAYLTKQINLRGGRVHANRHQIGSNDIFHLCYRGIVIEGLPIRGGELTRYARGLRCAYDNRVPVEYLIGYLYQTAGGRPAPQTPHQIAEDDEDWDDIYDPQADFDEDGIYIGRDDEAD